MRRPNELWLFNAAAVAVILLAVPFAWTWLDAARPAAFATAAPATPLDQGTHASAPASAKSGTESAAYSASLAYGDGGWAPTAPLPAPNWGAGSAVLADGRVLVAGGASGRTSRTATAATELFNATTGQWKAATDMLQARAYAAAVLLADGSVLVVGGSRDGGPLDSAERYFPASNTWIAAGRMHVARTHATATLLADGRVLVAGGVTEGSPGYHATAAAELYDPAAGSWSITGSMSVPRVLQVAARLPSGDVLVAGGADRYATALASAYASAEIYDVHSGTWHAAAAMSIARYAAAAVATRDGRVVVAGGWSGLALEAPSTATAEAYDPTQDRWVAVGPMGDGRAQFRMAALPDGRLLAAGGISPSGTALASADLYDPATRTWRAVGDLPGVALWPALDVLRDGRVLVAGGALDGNANAVSATAAVFTAPAP